jgi:polar amino acid transport system substrate-binding protein
MAAGLAHEIRNPLVSIRTFTQLLPERIGDREFRESFLDLTLSEVDRICALINELLAFARPAPAELHRVSLNECLDRVCLLLDSQARNVGVQLVRHLHPGRLELTADEDQIKQVVINMILNAIQACSARRDTRAGGTVTVRSYPNRLERGDYVCIEVVDDGIGIDPEIVERIFDPFFTTRKEGTGLGLSIAHQIVTRHGGFIDVTSEPGGGASFCVNLPAEAYPLPSMVSIHASELSLHG